MNHAQVLVVLACAASLMPLLAFHFLVFLSSIFEHVKDADFARKKAKHRAKPSESRRYDASSPSSAHLWLI